MFNKKSLTIAMTLASLPMASSAKSLPLIESCVELINIYESKHETKLLAAQTTSLAESLRAGYCLGVLEQYAKSEYRCRSDWYDRAQFIARESLKQNPLSERKLLELSCEI
ncbi:hypothetical protein A6E14_16950 [Vibrio genomosp. F10]|uniref:Uncharacterized protein n=2 Tax=Vibrio genomosp. F10 TaxID=723171 RepID=A0A1B9R3N1_9VIBR|nr:hypothetical protein A6E14_16950 [Vibrio genomosp. F10]